jgi:hypothetical protein
VSERCDLGDDATSGGPVSLCDTCTEDADCAGHTGELGGTFCQPLSGDSDETLCLVDCSEEAANCGEGFTCNEDGNCVPDLASCDEFVAECGSRAPYGSCPDGQTCTDGIALPS